VGDNKKKNFCSAIARQVVLKKKQLGYEQFITSKYCIKNIYIYVLLQFHLH
jgi:hypothetical protein